jgi:hypothetical protein
MARFDPFSDEQARALVNLDHLASLPYDLRRKEVGGRSYLYEIADRSGNGKSLGPWSPENEAKFDDYRQKKIAAKERWDASRKTLDETARLCRALRLPQLAGPAGEISREADRRKLLGTHLLVVGTNAMIAYSVEAGGFIRAPDETADFDMAWSAVAHDVDQRVIWDLLKAVDPTFTVNTERPFQARNKNAYEVEILVAPSRAGTMSRTDQPMPMALPEQEWLVKGRVVDRVVVCRDGTAARIVVPDPRWFALQKLWMSGQAKRNPLKRNKDAKQGNALLDVVGTAMPQYPLDGEFEASLPDELKPLYETWKTQF